MLQQHCMIRFEKKKKLSQQLPVTTWTFLMFRTGDENKVVTCWCPVVENEGLRLVSLT